MRISISNYSTTADDIAPYGDGVTFWPIYEIVRGAAGIADEDPRETALAKIMDGTYGICEGTGAPTKTAAPTPVAVTS